MHNIELNKTEQRIIMLLQMNKKQSIDNVAQAKNLVIKAVSEQRELDEDIQANIKRIVEAAGHDFDNQTWELDETMQELRIKEAKK